MFDNNQKISFLKLYFLPRLRRECFHGGVFDAERGKWQYHIVQDRRPSQEDLQRHVDGQRPVSVFYDATLDDNVRLAKLDVDNKSGLPDAVVAAYVEHLAKALNVYGLHPLTTRSTGGKGVHLDFYWVKDQLRIFVLGTLKAAVESCGPPPAGIHVEFFPKRSDVEAEGKPRGCNLPFGCGHDAVVAQQGRFISLQLDTGFQWKKSGPVPEIPDPDVLAEELEPDVDIEGTFLDGATITTALEAIREPDHDTRVAVGMALKAVYNGFGREGERGIDWWLAWVRLQAPQTWEKHGAEGLRREWQGFVPKRTGLGAILKRARQGGWKPPENMAFRCTDRSCALLTARREDALVRVVLDENAWFYWSESEHLWLRDAQRSEARKVVDRTADHLRGYAVKRMRKGVEVATMKHVLAYASSLEQDRARNDVVNFMETVPPFEIKERAQAFDRDLGLLLFADGQLLDTRNWTVRAAEPSDYITQKLRVAYASPDNRLTSPYFDKYIAHLVPDADARAMVLQALGLALMGRGATLKAFLYFIGENGDEGKSVLFKLLRLVMGSMYHAFGQRDLVKTRWASDTGLTPQIVAVRGKRLAVLPETSAHQSLDDGIFKWLTGDDPLTGRDIATKAESFAPTHLTCGFGNEEIRITTDNEATWRRVLNITCPNPVERSQQIERFEELMFAEEGSAIVARMLLAAREMGHKLIVPQSVRDATAEYRERQQDWLRDGLQDVLVSAGPADMVTAARLLLALRQWYRRVHNEEMPEMSTKQLAASVRRVAVEGTRPYDMHKHKEKKDRDARLYGWRVVGF